MKTKALGITIAVITIAIVAGVVWWESSSLTSPGPLHASHASLAALSGSNTCKACHGEGQQTMAEACMACHEPILKQQADRAGLHGSLAPDLFASCGSCHAEHNAGSVQLVSELSFSLSGVENARQYDHSHVSAFMLTDAHDSLACTACHELAWNASLEAGQHRFLGQSQSCEACHTDPHHGELPECEKCHGQSEPFTEAPGFEHSSFPLIDGHSVADCRECHEDTSYANAPTECAACHSDDFEATLNPPHLAVNFGTDCATCHTITKWADAAYEHTDRFPLAGSHANLTCTQCHENTPGALETLTDASCAACHDSSHSSTFASAIPGVLGTPRFEDSCTACHDAMHTSFRLPDAKLSPAHHIATGFPLVSPHDTQDCTQCHAAADDGNGWHGLYPGRHPNDCKVCHGDPHLGQFSQSPMGEDCLSCHVPDRFVPTKFDVTMHASCAFPLTGAHKAISCQSCHESREGMMQFIPTPSACADCHEDVHEGRFDTPELADLPGDQSGCARCHVTTSFNDVSWSSEQHEQWTGYALKGAHASASCAACHTGTDDLGIRSFIVPDQACASCHADEHAGQFEVAGVTDCARCHVETGFYNLTFDHNRDAKFALDEHHATLSCNSCHAVYETPAGPVTRYKPLGMQCVDCHGDPDDIGGR